MLDSLLGVLIAVMLAYAFKVWRDLRARETELKVKLRRRERLQEELRQTTDTLSMSLDDLTRDVARLDAELEHEKSELIVRERRLNELLAREPLDIIVFDRAALTADNLWEVDVSNPQVHELAATKRAPASFAEGWIEGRCFLIASSTEADAITRCQSRFPASLGYKVDAIRRFRGLNTAAVSTR